MIINKTEKFKLRKSKKYKNLVSVGLGVMTAVAIGVASDNEAYASDQTVGNATNSATTQPPANKVQNDNLANTNTSTGAVNININNSNVKNAVNRAKNEGVNVVEKTQDLGVTTNAEETRRKRNEAIEQNKVEENKINEVVNNYKKEKEANQNAINTATSENREKQAQYERALANYQREKSEKESQNAAIRKENEGINTRNNDKKAEYEENLKRAGKAQKQNEQDLENEKELIVQKGGERESSSNGIKVKEGERIDVRASGNITIKSVTPAETVTDTRLTLTLPNTDIRNGSYIDLKYERLREEQLKDYDVKVNGEKIGTLKLVSIDHTRNADYDPKREEETIDGYTSMHNYNFRLIFNENANKYKNRVVTISSNNTANWNGVYGREKQGVNHNIYVNGVKVVSSAEHSIPAADLSGYRYWERITALDTVIGVFINEDGEIRPNGMFGRIANSHEQADTRINKLTDGDIITYRIDNNAPVKFDPTQRYDAQNMFKDLTANFGYNINKHGSLTSTGNHLPHIEVLNFTDTELKVKITNVDNRYVSLYTDSYKRIPLKITSYNKADYASDRKYSISATVQDANGTIKAQNNTSNSIGISGADINSVGELKPYEEKEKFKIKVNYVDTSGKVIKAPYGENNLAYGDKYTVNVPSISNYAFIREKDDKVLNGVFREDLEYTLVYKKLDNIIHVLPPKYETPKPELPLPKEPKQPTPTPIPSGVTAPTVGYTTFRLAERPRVFKEAKNLDNISLDNSLVSKNSTVKFTLKVDKLPAGREALNVLEFTDHLPQGYVIDEATVTRENNALGYNTAYDKANHTVVFSANSTLLNKLNTNLNEVVDVVAPTVTGTVTNDGGIYKNNFKINLNNKYTTHSNVVTVNTPNGITPNKVNTNADNSNIDGKIVVAETTNYYKLLWDLDQYRGMKLSRNDIAKGFYYLEDYPEEAVTINNRLVSLVDSNGQAVTGVEVNSYDNLESAPENVKTMLSKANITPKGAFQLFTATNPTDFYNKYVVTGNSIKITNPMVVKDSLTQTGGVYENKAYQIDLGNGYATETVRNIVPKVDTNKHNYNEDGVLIDGKQVVAGTTNHYKLTWDLDQYRGMSATNSEIAKGFFFVEDYPEEALTIDNSKVTMLDGKGQAVTGVEVSSYNSLENAPEDIKQALVNAKIRPKGAFQLFRATNAKDFFNKYVLTGNSITITTPMKVKEELTTTGGTYNNKAYQVDFGKAFETNIVTNIVPKVTPEKHNTNEDGVVVDGKQIVAGTTNYYKLTWDLTPYRGVVPTRNELNKGFFFVEDYPEKEVTIDNSRVTMVDSKGQAVTGVEVRSYNSLEEAPENVKTMLSKANISPKGAFQLFNASSPMDFFNKYASVGNSITITTPMKVKEELTTTGGTIRNKGYQIDFGKGRETEIITNEIPKVTPEKHNTNEDGVVVDGKQIVAGTTNYYKLTWDLTPYRGVVPTRNELNKGFFFVEDYPEKEVTIDNSKVTMVDSKGQAVTGVEVSSYNSLEEAPENVRTMLSKANISPKGAFQLFNASSPMDFFNKYASVGNSITITTPMKVKEELTTTGGTIRNKGYQIDFGKGRETEIITNEIPKVTPEKHNTNEDGVVVDGKQIVAGTTNYYKLTWDLTPYRGVVPTRNELNKGFFFVEDYPEKEVTIDNSKVTMVDSKGQAVTGVEVSSYNSLEEAPENVKTMLSKANISPKGAFQLFRASSPMDFFNKYASVGNSITITTPMKVKEELTTTGGTIRNKGYQIDFGKGRETEIITNEIPKVTPEKHNTNEDGVVVDGKQVVAGTTNHYKLTWDLDQYRDMTATSREVARGFFVVEDYPEEALTIDNSKVTMVDSKGQAVTGVEVLSYDSVENAPDDIKKALVNAKITPKGAFQLFRATNSRDFFNKYVLTGNSITITTPMTVKEELTTTGGVFNNKMYQVDFGKGREVEHEVTNNIPKVEPTKHNTNEDGVVVDGKVIAPETVNNYKLLWDLDQYKGVVATSRELAKGFYFVEDYPEEALAINNSKVTMVDSKGQAVTGVEVLSYDSVENAPDDIKKALVNAKITPKGAFQVYKATNSREFYDKYVFTGNSITITSPMTMLDGVNKNGAVYNNKAYQIDFGKGRETDVVKNTVPKSNPEKHNYNEDGVLIDGGLVPVGSTTEYKLTWKLSNLRDVVGTNEAINRGFYYIDDYPEVLKTLDDRIKVLDSNGNVVNGIRVTKYDNLEQASNEIKAILSKNNITPKGAFQVFSAENPIEFYNNYVKKGIDLTIVNPMQVTQALKESGGSYQNVAYEIDFGVAQVTDTVTNTVPKVKPVKHNYNEDNVKIDGKVVLAASRTNYKLNWNLSAYKNVEASDKYIKKGFYFVDDYPEEALSLDEKNITITDDKGKAVSGVEVVNYESLEKAPEEVKAVLKEAKVTPKGAFQLFKATDPKQFYNDYVKTGTNLTITNPMTVKPELARKDSKKVVDNISKETENKAVKDVTKVNNSTTTTNTKPKLDKAINEAVERENNTLNTISKVSVENTEKDKVTKGTGKTTEYKNRGYQIDFGNGYETDVVANNVPKIDPIKDVVIDVKGKESLQGKEIELNKFFNYKLIGTEIPSNRGTKLTQYGFSDDYDEKADKYQANYRVFSMKDIKLTDGSVIKQDSELTKYTTQIMKDGKVDIEFDKEFLDKVDLDSEFQAEVYLQMERIASGEVKNTFIHTVNGVEETSNTVTTLTKEPAKPEEPKQPETPKVEEKTPNKSTGKVLPNTGVADNDGTSTAIVLTALATAGFIARRKKVKNS